LTSILRALRAPGRVPALAVIALATAVRIWDPAPLREIQFRVFDLEQWAFPRSASGAVSLVRIVQIDQESIAKYGQWPWPRTLVAQLVERIGAGRPRVLGIDILFAEPDRTSPPILAEKDTGLPAPIREALAKLPSNDSHLAEAIRSVPAVLGFALADPKSTEPAALAEAADPQSALPEYVTMAKSLPEIARAARAEGSITVEPDEDGIFRRLPLAARHDGTTVPGFSVAILSVGFDAPFRGVRPARDGVEAVIGPNYLPADPSGAAWVYFGEPSLAYSAATMMDEAFDLSDLNDKIVLLAVTGFGKVDLQRTPLGLSYGVEFHAQLIDSMLTGERLFRPAAAFWIELAAVLLGGLAMVWLLRYEAPLLAAGGPAVALAALLGGEVLLFRFAGWLVDGVYPAAATLAAFGVMLQGSLRAAQAARRIAEMARQAAEAELQEQREQRARLDGELAAARTIQLGLLPHRFPAFPERGDIDIYARIEPAREIGGDLFDYFFIAADRLFFFIGDVSGKGPPAALFMVMTKEVVRDAAGRHGAALDRLLADANARIAAASGDFAEQGGDMMFVTAFAGILDLASGEIAYASAGHDSPFVLRQGERPRQLATEGGPPLGAVEDFDFPVDRDRLEPGEVLLLYTDGVTEAQDKTGALYSGERLAAFLPAAPNGSADELVLSVLDDVRRFAADAEQADDITLLGIRRVGSGS
jgi:serine phosphatase RsbU (regulator of sigma subunit)/CHASE2 domain-containing sensor protein